MASALLLMLFVPVVISTSIANTGLRVCIALIACWVFIFSLSVFADAETSELFVAKFHSNPCFRDVKNLWAGAKTDVSYVQDTLHHLLCSFLALTNSN